MSEYSAAIQAQHDFLSFIRGPAGYELMRYTLFDANMVDSTTPASRVHRSAISMRDALIDCCIAVDPYWISDEITQGLWAATDDMPAWDFDRDLLPDSHGFIWFERPLPELHDTPLVKQVPNPGVYGLAWCPAQYEELGRYGITLWELYYSAGDIIPTGMHVLIYGADRRAAFSGSGKEGPEDRYVDIFGAILYFIHQQVLTYRQELPDRATRRRMEREHSQVLARSVRVAYLRRSYARSVADEGSDDGGKEGNRKRDYSCQWLVGGHWRRQWYPARGTHQLKYIHPYVKGPSGKPFRTTGTRVFAVVR